MSQHRKLFKTIARGLKIPVKTAGHWREWPKGMGAYRAEGGSTRLQSWEEGTEASVLQDPVHSWDLTILTSAGSAAATSDVHSSQLSF